ncbi:TIGR02206 family membrane protein [Leucobacter denitrificans]|uniref:TIGR02206 family membrane protein n=2 Tax=Leucobacter denitrificans TaxID=683042 RepID=A0A7G9S804_9MICO|nr:TIGR02206 family membrane protein [Leucobacter denitrificans]
MTPYGAEHFAALAVTVVAAIVLVAWARKVRGTRAESRGLTVAGWIMLAATLTWMGWNFLPMNWNIEQSLPFHLSDALRIITSLALLTRSSWTIAISYYWGLTLNIQSVLTPDLTYFHAPLFEYIAYWFFHIAALIVPIMFVWGLEYRPTWRGYGVALAATLGWAGIAGIANALTGANYVYLARAPEVASALDLLGPWPIYILWELVLVASVWALITWPWTVGRNAQKPVVGRIAAVRRESLHR